MPDSIERSIGVSATRAIFGPGNESNIEFNEGKLYFFYQNLTPRGGHRFRWELHLGRMEVAAPVKSRVYSMTNRLGRLLEF